MTNMFDLVFPSGIPGASNSDGISARMDQSVEVPEDSVNVYDIFYKGIRITKTGTMTENEKKLTITLRLDQSWNIYDDLKRYKQMCYNSTNGTRLPDLSTRIPIAIQAVDGDNNVVKTIKFKQAKITSIKPTAFDPSTSEPTRLETQWIFGDIDDGVS